MSKTEAMPKAVDPEFDEDGNCTNYHNQTTCPRTPDNPGGHFVKAKDRISQAEKAALAEKASANALAADALADAAAQKAKDAAVASNRASLAAADAKKDAAEKREVATA